MRRHYTTIVDVHAGIWAGCGRMGFGKLGAMEVIIQKTDDAAAMLAARIVANELRANPHLVLGLATGKTMERVYAHLVRMHQQEKLDFSLCSTFNLDEYVGLPASDPHSYRHYMDQHLFGKVNLERHTTAAGTAI